MSHTIAELQCKLPSSSANGIENHYGKAEQPPIPELSSSFRQVNSTCVFIYIQDVTPEPTGPNLRKYRWYCMLGGPCAEYGRLLRGACYTLVHVP
ncbi:hypothetical protein GDO78_007872 [Eleutherodactylus coqui]|uniref:Uncharacterized protein n=1 Tax=Eleutherodactylus coqui TaxID=57060 RepID=A0A8J6FHR3_ELECQ|nr:hypothetical protein GDO78_007872 [Eleutherodactylus coqui]